MTLDALSQATSLTPRTIRFYIGEGIIPPPRNRGRGALYGEEHLAALRRILELRAQRFSLAEIRSIVRGSATDAPAGRGTQTPEAVLEEGSPPPLGESVRDYVRQALQDKGTVGWEMPPGRGTGAQLGFVGIAAAAPVRSRWTRHTIVDGLEMHIETGLPRDEARLVDYALRELRDKLLARRRAGGGKTR